MRYREVEVANAANALRTDRNPKSVIWFGDHTQYAEQEDTSEVFVGDEKRLMLGGLLKLASRYSLQANAREILGHDCVTFAYSWESGDTYDTTRALRAGGAMVRPRTLTRLSDDLTVAPSTLPGEIIYTVDALLTQADKMVYATVDDGQALYLSKFGAAGPIILTSFEQSLQLYPAQTAGVASNFEIQH